VNKFLNAFNIIQKNIEACILCGKVVSRASDTTRHMKRHDPNTKFVTTG